MREQTGKATKVLALALLILGGEANKSHIYLGISTHYQSYHDAFEMTRTISTLTSNVCIAHIGHEEDGSQEDWRIAFKYNYDTQVCQIGKVPFQLVRVVQDWVALNGSMPFVNNGNPELLYVCHGCMGAFTKIMVIGGNTWDLTAEVIDLSSSTTTCSPLPIVTSAPLYKPALVMHNDDPVICGGADNADALSADCYKLSADQTTWNKLSQGLSIARSYPIANQRDFNDFQVMGGRQDNANLVDQVTTSEWFVNGQFDPSGQVDNLPNQILNVPSGLCHVQVDMKTHFFAGGYNTAFTALDMAALWNSQTDQWTDLPKLERQKSYAVCAYFRNQKGETEIAVVGGFSSLGAMLNEVEIYNAVTLKKRLGTPHPQVNYFGAVAVQVADSFLLLGGSSGGFIDTIFRFDPVTETFNTLPQKMTQPRDNHVVVAVPDSMVICN